MYVPSPQEVRPLAHHVWRAVPAAAQQPRAAPGHKGDVVRLNLPLLGAVQVCAPQRRDSVALDAALAPERQVRGVRERAADEAGATARQRAPLRSAADGEVAELRVEGAGVALLDEAEQAARLVDGAEEALRRRRVWRAERGEGGEGGGALLGGQLAEVRAADPAADRVCEELDLAAGVFVSQRRRAGLDRLVVEGQRLVGREVGAPVLWGWDRLEDLQPVGEDERRDADWVAARLEGGDELRVVRLGPELGGADEDRLLGQGGGRGAARRRRRRRSPPSPRRASA
mmetsp:Transcript_38130/g.124726  ORF Transcript_38130/g.124726 Transcript_38130/m.124726 type:complete len:286 (+) Transcript_38130:227-1084(+)